MESVYVVVHMNIFWSFKSKFYLEDYRFLDYV